MRPVDVAASPRCGLATCGPDQRGPDACRDPRCASDPRSEGGAANRPRSDEPGWRRRPVSAEGSAVLASPLLENNSILGITHGCCCTRKSTGRRSTPIRASRRCTARRQRFLWGLMIFSMVYYFLLPIGAAYFQDLFKIKVWGVGQRRHPVRAVAVRRRLGHRLLLLAARQCRIRRHGAGDRQRLREEDGRPTNELAPNRSASPGLVGAAARSATPGARAGRGRRRSTAG